MSKNIQLNDASSDSIYLKIELNEDDKALWCILLKHAVNELFAKKQFCLSVDYILEHWTPMLCSKDENSLKATLLRLGTGVNYDIKKRADCDAKYGFFVLLESVYIINNECLYAFSKRCKEYIADQRDCAPIKNFLDSQRLTISTCIGQ